MYREEYAEQAGKYCLLGATDADLARLFEVSEATVNTWKQEHPEFLDSLKKGREVADAEVAKKLYHRALGYTHPEEKIFQHDGEIVRADTLKHYPPDPTAAIFWLKNRKSDLWRDRQDIHATVEHSFELLLADVDEPGDGPEE